MIGQKTLELAVADAGRLSPVDTNEVRCIIELEDFAALLALAAGELGEEVFVDLAEEVAGGGGGDVGEGAEELAREGRVAAGEGDVAVLGEDAVELGFMLLDRGEGGLEGLGDVLSFGEVEEVVVAGVVGQVEAAFLDGNFGEGFSRRVPWSFWYSATMAASWRR